MEDVFMTVRDDGYCEVCEESVVPAEREGLEVVDYARSHRRWHREVQALGDFLTGQRPHAKRHFALLFPRLLPRDMQELMTGALARARVSSDAGGER